MNYIYATEVQIYDLPLQNPATPSMPGFVDVSRTECFDACIRAIKLALDCHLSFEPSEYVGLPMSVSMTGSSASIAILPVALYAWSFTYPVTRNYAMPSRSPGSPHEPTRTRPRCTLC